MSEPQKPAGEADHMEGVDQHPDAHRPTEADEEQVLSGLYGGPDRDGVYRGEGEGRHADGRFEPYDWEA
jgi:hypothetical protein